MVVETPSKRRIAFLTSNTPLYGNRRAGSTVQLALAIALINSGYKVDIHLCNKSDPVDSRTDRILCGYGIRVIDWGDALPTNQAFTPFPTRNELSHIIDAINGAEYQCVISFWDTKLEFVLPYITTIKIGYLAQPICQAWLILLSSRLQMPSIVEHHTAGAFLTVEDQINRFSSYGEFPGKESVLDALKQQCNHISNLKSLNYAFCIAKRGASWYTRNGVHASYLPNCWPEFPLESDSLDCIINPRAWEDYKPCCPNLANTEGPFRVLANVGRLDTHTGNLQGLDYLVDNILPALHSCGDSLNIEFLIPGAGQPVDRHLSMLSSTYVRYLGFAPRFETVLNACHALLILNNTGKYSAGYTRCMVAMQRGMPIIAADDLANEVPEITDANSFLFSSPKQAVSLLKALTQRTQGMLETYTSKSISARNTYLSSFRPSVIISALLRSIE